MDIPGYLNNSDVHIVSVFDEICNLNRWFSNDLFGIVHAFLLNFAGNWNRLVSA